MGNKQIFYVILLILLSFNALSLDMDTKVQQYVEEENLIYITSENEFYLELKDKEEIVLMTWTIEDFTKNEENYYKLYLNYPKKIKNGHYSLVLTDKNDNIRTTDIEIKRYDPIKLIIKSFSKLWNTIIVMLS